MTCSGSRGRVEIQSKVTCKGHPSQGEVERSPELLPRIYPQPARPNAGLSLCIQPVLTQVPRVPPYTMPGLFESHWGYFLGNVSFIQNSVFSKLILH